MSTKKPAKPAPPSINDEAFPINKIRVTRVKNVREKLGDLSSLTYSIMNDGVLAPVIVVPICDPETGVWTGEVDLVAGWRRYTASKKMGLTVIPVRSRDLNDAGTVRTQLVENLQREDMNPLDVATAIVRLMELDGSSQKEIADQLSVSESYVSNHVGLLNLPEKAQKAVRSGDLRLGHARCLFRVKDEATQLALLKDAQTLSVTELDNKVDFVLQKNKEGAKEARMLEAAAASQRGLSETPKRKETEAASPKRKEADGASPKGQRKTRAAKTDADHDADDAKPTLAEEYEKKTIKPLTKADMLGKLKYYANKYENADTEAKKLEYRFILKGLEIASSL